MPRIINAYDGNSAIGDSLSKLGESIYGDQAKHEVDRQKARAQTYLNDRVIDPTVGVDDAQLAKAQLGIGGTAGGTFIGQGRSLANDRSIAGGHDAATRYGVDRRYDSDIATTGMNNENRVTTTRMNNDTQRDIDLSRDARTSTPVRNPDGSYSYYAKSEANERHLTPVVTPDQVKGGAIADMLQKRAPQPSVSPFTTGAPAWNTSAGNAAPAPAPQPGAVNAGMYGQRTPQELDILGVKRQPLVNPRTGQTDESWDGGSTLANGQPATGYMPTTDEHALAAEKANNVRTAASTALPPAPTEYPQYAQDAAKTSGLGSVVQHEANALVGAFGGPEVGANTNRARENLTNTNNTVRSLYASAPGTRAAVYREKNADKALPEPGLFGMTGINADEQRERAMSEITHLRQQYALVQADAQDPNTPPEEAAKMLTWLHSARDAIATMSRPAAGAQQPAAAAPQQAAKPQTVVQNGHTYNLQPDGSYQ